MLRVDPVRASPLRSRTPSWPPLRAGNVFVKPLADTLWSIVRWTLPLTVAAIVVAAALGSQRVGEEVRLRVETRLREHFPTLEVQVRSASLVEGEGILIRDLSLAEAGQPPLVTVEEIHLACGTSLTELAAGAPRIAAVRLRRPVVQARRDGSGHWNVATLFESRQGGARLPVTIEDATLAVEDALLGRRFTLRNIGMALEPQTDDGGSSRTAVRGRVGGDLFERADFEGHMTVDGEFNLAGHVEALDLSPRLRGFLPAGGGLADLADSVRGRLDLDWTAAGALASLEEVSFGVSGRLAGGHFEHASLPMAVSDVAASFTADRSGVACERFEGHSGSTLVRGSGRLAGWDASADFDVAVEVERLLVGRHWEPYLPAALASQWSKLLPAGDVDLQARLSRRAGQTSRDLSIRCRNLSLTYYRFPYRLDRTVGTMTYRDGAVTIHLTGLAGGHPVHVEGAVDMSKQGHPGVIELRGEGMRIDDALLAALPAKGAEVVRRLRATGTFDFAFRHERRQDHPRGFLNTLGLRLSRCTFAYAGFPYPVSNVSGGIHMEGNRWVIRDVTGTNDTGVIRCKGVLEADENGRDVLTLDVTGNDIVLEPELRDALPPGMRQIWDDVDPRGSAEFTASIRHEVAARRTEVELYATPQGDTVSIEPAWFPYRLEQLQGRLAWKDGILRFDGVRGVHARTTVSTEGTCRFGADGGWHVSFSRLAADRFRAEHEVLRALPTGLQQAVSDIGLKGLLSVDGALDIYSTAPREVTLPGGRTELVPGPAAASWDMQLDVEQASLNAGVPFEHVCGSIRLRGSSDGQAWRSFGDLMVDSALYRGLQLTAIRGPVVFDAAGARFGSPAAAVSEPGTPRRLTARLAGGTLQLDAQVAAGPVGEFTVGLALSDVDLAQFAADLAGRATTSRGRVQAAIEMSGTRSGTHSLLGRGHVRLRDANLYELPVIVSMLKILRVRAPDRTAFGSSQIDFHIEGPRAYLDTIELSGDAISLVGAGEIDLDSNISLTFRPLMGESENQLPAMKRFLGGAGGQFMLVHVGGTLSEPITTTEAFPTLAAAAQRLQAQRRDPPAGRSAGRLEPLR